MPPISNYYLVVKCLEEQNNLDFYNIKDNDTIFYLYKKVKKTKSKNNNNINKKQEINTNTIFQENKPIEIGNDIDNDNLNIKLKIYSSIIKIMTYKINMMLKQF